MSVIEAKKKKARTQDGRDAQIRKMQQDLTDRINQEVSEYNRAWAKRLFEERMSQSEPRNL